MRSVGERAAAAYAANDVAEKLRLTRETAAAWAAGDLLLEGPANPPRARPGRPARPVLRPPRDVPRRSVASVAGRVALLHAIAHIELNAVDLALDLVARFAWSAPILDEDRDEFVSDWLGVADDEARHFAMIDARLGDWGAAYGDHPAHDGLWSAAERTMADLPARLAVAPMTLEARGLDVTPKMIETFTQNGDEKSAAILRIIYEEEVSHVAAGRRWFDRLCAREGLQPPETYQKLIRRYFGDRLKPPFNEPKRDEAGLFAEYYADLAC